MQPTRIPLDELISDPHNVRTHDERNLRAIMASLETFGQQKPIVISRDNIVLAGNGTLEAARRLHWDSLWTITSDLSSEHGTAYAIADNRTGELADWDLEKLQQQLDDLAEADLALETVGFDTAALDELLKDTQSAIDDDLPTRSFPDDPLYQILIECHDEADQCRILDLLAEHDIPSRPLIA